MPWFERTLKKMTVFLCDFMIVTPDDLEDIRSRERTPRQPNVDPRQQQAVYRFNR